jgi:hypothetical protein
MEEQQFIVIKDSSNIDVLDENLYSYENTVFALTPAMQKRTSDNLLETIQKFIDSFPAIQKAVDNVKSKTEYIPRLDLLSDEIKSLLQEGKVELIPCKKFSDATYLQIRSTIKGLVVNGKEYGKNIKIKDIPLSTNTVPTDIVGAMQCLSMQGQLNQIADGLKEISKACELNFGRIIQGQRDDRLAKLLSGRSCFIQAVAISDNVLQRQLLVQAIVDANAARAELAMQIKSDINTLCEKSKLKSDDTRKIVNDINTSIVAMNNAVQLLLYSYQALGQHNAQLSVIKEHETFIKRVLLKEINYKGKKHIAWNVICSHKGSGSDTNNVYSLPKKVIDSCINFIDNKSENLTIY